MDKQSAKEWYLKADQVPRPEEDWAAEMLRFNNPRAIEIMDERIRRVSAQIKESWSDSERKKRFVGNIEDYAKTRVVITDHNWREYLHDD